MKLKRSFHAAKFSSQAIHVNFIFQAMVCLALCLVSSHQIAAQQIRSAVLVHPDGTFLPNSMNNLAQIAGTVSVNDTTYHAVRREQDGQYTNLPELGGNLSQAYCMNDLGEVGGITIDENGFGHTVVWEKGGMRELSVPLDASIAPIPIDINDSGLVTGYYWDMSGITYALVWDTNGVFQFLPIDNGTQAIPSAMNDAGAVVGMVQMPDGTTRAYLWQPDSSLKSLSSAQAVNYSSMDIGTLGGPGARAMDINNRGQVVGFASYDSEGQFVHAFFWQDSIMVDLGTLGGDNSIATSINEQGIVIGRSELADSAVSKSDAPANQNWNPGFDFEGLKKGHGFIPSQSIQFRVVQDGEHDVFFAYQKHKLRGWIMGNPEDAGYLDVDIDLDDTWSLNSDMAALSWDDETGYYVHFSNILRYINPSAMLGIPGFHWAPYNSYNSAVADDTQVMPTKFYWSSGVFPGDINIKSGAENSFYTYGGFGHSLIINPSNLNEVLDGKFSVEPGGSVTFGGGRDNTWIIDDEVTINGKFHSLNGMNHVFRNNISIGKDASLIFGASKKDPSLVQFDGGVMGEGDVHFKHSGSSQINLGGDFGATLNVAKKETGQLVIDSRGWSFGDVNLKSGSIIPLYGFTMNSTAKLGLSQGRIRSLFGGAFTFNNPDPEGITGASDSAYIRMPLHRYLGGAGSYIFPLGDFNYYSPISFKFDDDPGTKISLTSEYGREEDLEEPSEDLYVYVPILGRNLRLDVLYPYGWKVKKEGELSEDPDVWVEPRGLDNVKTLFSLHLAQVDLGTGFLEVAGKDPTRVESFLIDGVPMVCQPEVKVKDSMLVGIATNGFLNPINRPATELFVRTRFINLTTGFSGMDTYVNNRNIHFPLGFQYGSPYGAVSEGFTKVEAVDSTEQDNGNPAISKFIEFSAMNNYTIIAAGMGTELNFFVDSNASLAAADSSMVKIKLFHGHPDVGPLSIMPKINGNMVSYELQADYGEFSESKSEVPAFMEIPIFGSLFRYDLRERAGESLLFAVTRRIVNESTELKSTDIDFDLILLDTLGLKVEPVAVTSVDESRQLPGELALQANYPNPFEHSTKISYLLSQASFVKLTITNALGQQVRKLVDAQQQPGYYTVEWAGRNDAGKALPPGVYLYRLEAGNFTQARTMMMLK